MKCEGRIHLRLLSWLLPGLLAISLVPTVSAREKDKDALKLSGFVGLSSTQPASKVVVKLLDGESGKVLDMAETGILGRYKFEKLRPGLYVLQVGELKREVLLKDKDKRVDIDMSAKDGVARSFKTEDLVNALGGAATGTTAGPAPGPNDPNLMQTMAGQYWGYQGSTEVKLALCSSGSFQEYSESSYSGRSNDSLGNQTGAWGAASQGGRRGNWSVQGNTRQGTINLAYAGGKPVAVRYQAVDQQCFNFEGRTLCRTGAANCR